LDAQPPAIVWEGRAVCAHSDHSESLFRRGLSSSMAPGAMWVVNVHLEINRRRTVTAESEITDDDGMTVAHRTLVGADCDGLARAAGVWASLVLDSELAHAAAGVEAKEEPPTQTEPDAHPEAPWPAPALREEPPAEADVFYEHPESRRDFEAGGAVFLMTGTGGAAVGGASPFLTIESGHGIYLRPSLIFGQSLTSLSPSVDSRANVAAGRLDACVRMPGLYTQHRGIQLDACLGSDVGALVIGGTGKGNSGAPANDFATFYASVGPSLELRGELGSSLSATLRGLLGENFFNKGFDDGTGAYVAPMPYTGRVELAFSWGLR
jgi:hypothetical protein